MTFTLAVDREAKYLTIDSWDLATKIMGLSKLVLLKNQSGILKSKEDQLEDDIVAYLKRTWSGGETCSAQKIWRNFRSRFKHNHKLWEEMQKSLQYLGIVSIKENEGPGRKSLQLCKPVE